MKLIQLIVLTAVPLVAVTGCKKASESVAEKIIERSLEQEGGKARVDLQEGKVTIEGKDGTVEVAGGGGATIPPEFPKDVFLLKDAKVLMSLKSPDGVQLMLESKESMSRAAERYAAEMKALGWEEETSVNTAESIMRSYKKGDREAMVVISKAAEGSQIQVMAKIP